MELIVGTDSSWSLRAWISMRLAGVVFTEKVIDLSSVEYKAEILKYSSVGLVPVLVDGDRVVSDSFAIVEYINEYAGGVLYPMEAGERALARSLCAEMHSGFLAVRSEYPFSLGTSIHSIMDESVKIEIARIEKLFSSAQLPYMFASACAVDSFYSILAYRLKSYGILFKGKAGEYQRCLLDWSLLNEAIERAKKWKST